MSDNSKRINLKGRTFFIHTYGDGEDYITCKGEALEEVWQAMTGTAVEDCQLADADWWNETYSSGMLRADVYFEDAALHIIEVPPDLTFPSGWQPIETAPKDRRILIWSGQETYAAHWVKNPFTDHEAWLIGTAADDDETQLLIENPTHWYPCPEGMNK